MSLLHDDRNDDFDHGRPREREVTLSTLTILGIFFGLVVLCGGFFGFGYNLGTKSRPAPIVTEDGAPAQANFDAFKPSSGTPAVQPAPGYLSPAQAEAANKGASVSAYPAGSAAGTSPVKPPPPAHVTAPVAVAETTSPAAPIVRPPAPVHIAPTAPEPAAPAVGTGSFMVQIAAVTHQEDADLMITSLKRRGYAVVSRTEPQDHFFHIQVGPFPNKKDAEAMRQRLIGDGYLAIVK